MMVFREGRATIGETGASAETGAGVLFEGVESWTGWGGEAGHEDEGGFAHLSRRLGRQLTQGLPCLDTGTALTDTRVVTPTTGRTCGCGLTDTMGQRRKHRCRGETTFYSGPCHCTFAVFTVWCTIVTVPVWATHAVKAVALHTG